MGGDERLKIDEDNVLALSEDLRAGDPFALAAAVGELNFSKGLYLLHKNLQQGEPPFLLLSIIGRQLRLIWKAKELRRQGLSCKEIERQLKIIPSLAKDFWRQADKIPFQKLEESWAILERLDLEMKTSRLPKSLILERYFWDFFKPA